LDGRQRMKLVFAKLIHLGRTPTRSMGANQI
jgi:hypothetical protein